MLYTEQTKGHDMSTMNLGQLFTQINQLIQVDAPDWTATGFYVVDPSHKDCQSGGTEVHFHVAYNVPKQNLCSAQYVASRLHTITR